MKNVTHNIETIVQSHRKLSLFAGLLILIPLLIASLSGISSTSSVDISKASIIAPQKDYMASQAVTFTLVFEEVEKQSLAFIPQAFAEDEPKITTTLLDPKGDKTRTSIDIKPSINKSYDISIAPPNSFVPGQYELITEIESGDQRKKLSQNFSWGVLALNPDKATYKPGEKAQIHMAVLDDKGHMVCDAEIILEITHPDGTNSTKTTSEGSIVTNEICFSTELSLTPDYETTFDLKEEGEYLLTLTAKTENGTHTVRDLIVVTNEIDFDIKRVSATRLFPLNEYPMTIIVRPHKDFTGTVIERVPKSFAIIKTKQDTRETDYAALISENDTEKLITWNVSWKKGQTYTLSYTYNPPDVSPEFYLVGNLSLSNDFSENRYWHLANDAVGIARPDGDVAVGENFASCVTNGNGSCRFGVVDEETEITGDYVSTGTANDDGTGGDEEEFTMTSVAGALATVTQVEVSYQVQAVGGCQSTCDSVTTRIFIDGGYQTGQTTDVTASDALVTETFTGTWTGDDDLQIEFVRNINGTGGPSGRDDDVRIYQAYATVTYTAIDVSGNVYNAGTSSALTECDANAGTHELSLRANGTTYTTSCSSTDGSYTFTGVVAPSAGGGMVVWIDDTEAPETDGALVIRYDGVGDSTNNIFYDDTVTVTSDDTNGVTNAIMDTYDNSNDGDIPYTVTTNNLTVNSGYELLIQKKSGVANGSTVFSPGGTVTTNTTGGNLHIEDNGLAILDTATNSIGADITIDTGATLRINADTIVGGGDITATGTLTTTSGSPTVTMRGTGSISGAGTKTFHNLTVGDGTTATTTLSGTATANGDVSVGSGSTLNVNADLAISGGDFTTTTTGVVDTTSGTPTVTISGTGNIGAGSGGSFTLYDLTIDGTQTMTGDITTDNDVTINDTRSLALGSQNLTISGGDLNTTGTGTVTCSGCSGGTLTVAGTGSIGTSGSVTAYNIAINGPQVLGATVTANNDVSVAAGATLDLNNQNLNINGGDLTTTSTGRIICTGCGSSTVTLSGTGNIGGGTGEITFYNLTTSGTGTTTFTNGGVNTVTNNITVGASTTLNINSDITITGSLANSGTIGTSAGTPTVTVQGTTIGGASGDMTFYNLEKSGAGTTTFSGSGTNTINNNLSVLAGTLTQSSPLTVTGDVSIADSSTFNTNATLNINGGALTTAGSGIIDTTGGTATTTISGTGNIGGGGTVTVYNLVVNGNQTLQGALATTNDLAINASDTLALNGQDVTVGGGDFTTGAGASVTCGCASGTVTVNGTGSIGIGGNSVTVNFYNLTIGGTIPLASPISVSNDLTANGTLSGSQTVTVNGSVAGSGTVTMSGGTFNQRVGANETFGSTSGSNNWTFSTLIFSNSSGSSRTISANSGGSGTITTSVSLAIGQGGDSAATILNAGTRNWIIAGTSGSPFTLPFGNIASSTSTFTYTGNNAGGNTTLADVGYYNLILNNGSETYNAGGALFVLSDLTVTAGTLDLQANDLAVGSSFISNSGDLTVTGALNQTSGSTTIESSSGGSATIGGSGSITFYNLLFQPTVASAPTFTLGSAGSQTITISNDMTVGNGSNGVVVTASTNDPIIDINGSLTINSSGTLTAPDAAGALRIAQNMTNNGTFNAGSGTVTLDTSSTSTLDGSGSPAITFNGFSVQTPGKIVQFTAGKTFRTNGLLTVSGADSNQVHFHSTTPSQWFINHQGTEDISYLHVHDAGCDGSSTGIGLTPNSTNAGNNGTCWIFQIGKRVQGTANIRGNVRIR